MKKNPAAVALGRLGGLAKATKPKGLAAVSKKKRAEISAAGVLAKAKARRELPGLKRELLRLLKEGHEMTKDMD